MKRYPLFLLSLLMVCGCSNDDGNQTTPDPNGRYFNFTAHGITVPVESPGTDASTHRGGIGLANDIFNISVTSGIATDNDRVHHWNIRFDKQGRVLSAKWRGAGPRYSNYKHFPSHYFSVNIVSLDEVNHRIKLNFSGSLYRDWLNLNSETGIISGALDLDYSVGNSVQYELTYDGVEQYCSANLNGMPWKAYFEHEYGTFYSFDPFKIQVHFGPGGATGSFEFDQNSTDNYVRISKFNPQTLQYDEYVATGNVGYSYREFHGANKYSYIGTFNFTAVNVNNPSDVIQVTDGTFRSFQTL